MRPDFDALIDELLAALGQQLRHGSVYTPEPIDYDYAAGASARVAVAEEAIALKVPPHSRWEVRERIWHVVWDHGDACFAERFPDAQTALAAAGADAKLAAATRALKARIAAAFSTPTD